MIQPLSIYVHVPFCASRCGYCDFNTYTLTDLGGSVDRDSFHEMLAAEVRLAARSLGAASRPVDSVFFGGGTPTLLSAAALVEVLTVIDGEFGLLPGAEVTTEANPDSVDKWKLAALREGGFNRISFGVQSAASTVLKILNRTHTAGAAGVAIHNALGAGFDHVSADLILGTPGETGADVEASVDLVCEAGVDHLSAYTLIVEPNTPLAREVASGRLPSPDDDVAAETYEQVDRLLAQRGFHWYEVSNWARPGAKCRHNEHYWRSDEWWGVGPGAHSHVAGVRWWNLKHPGRYAERLAANCSPMEGSEELSMEQQRAEALMLGLRTADGAYARAVGGIDEEVVHSLIAEGRLDAESWARGQLVVTPGGRLFADATVRRLLD